MSLGSAVVSAAYGRGVKRLIPWLIWEAAPEVAPDSAPGAGLPGAGPSNARPPGQVSLRPLRLADEHRYIALRAANRDWLTPWDATSPLGDDRSASPGARYRAMTRQLTRSARRGEHLPWLIWYDDRATGEAQGAEASRMVGQLTAGPIIYGSARTASLGYWIDQGHAGRGIMTCAVALAVEHLLGARDLHRVEINIRPENHASLAVVRKLGLREEGLRRQYLHIAGDWRDHRSFAITQDELPDMRRVLGQMAR